MRNESDLSLRWNADRVPVFGSFIGQANVIGTVIFMSAFVISVPSWVNEKKPHVNVNKSIWSSTLTSNFIKASFGYLAGITYRSSSSSNVLNVISRHAPAGPLGVVTRIAVYLFNFATIIPGIPVISIFVRYNLVTAKFCPPWVANMIGVVAPWVVSMFFYHGRGLSIVVNWSAILFQGFINFAVPAMLYYFAIKLYPHFPDLVIEHLSDDDCFGPSHLPNADPTIQDNDHTFLDDQEDDNPFASPQKTILSINHLGVEKRRSSNTKREFITPLNTESSSGATGNDHGGSNLHATLHHNKHPVIAIHHPDGLAGLHGTHDHGADGCVIHHTDLNKEFGAVVDDQTLDPQKSLDFASSTPSSTAQPLYPTLSDAKDKNKKGDYADISLEDDSLTLNDGGRGSVKGTTGINKDRDSRITSGTISSSKASSATPHLASYGSHGNSSDDDSDRDLEGSHSSEHTPGWFFANQSLKLRPIDSLPRKLPNRWKMVTALGMVGVMIAMTLTALTLDFYFLAKHKDIVD